MGEPGARWWQRFPTKRRREAQARFRNAVLSVAAIRDEYPSLTIMGLDMADYWGTKSLEMRATEMEELHDRLSS